MSDFPHRQDCCGGDPSCPLRHNCWSLVTIGGGQSDDRDQAEPNPIGPERSDIA